ncbi:hypothetical protein QJS10_CPB04g01128 [Acorus calamus]|uniref:Uncharacterized protein n=1 Tax=Acorus calamus TaxID=4465 RepID=A0AAV9EWL6_ACOCL|nr:hypothetical protein QJS10_CPB04g01128 [Acorus calamus]
MEDGGRRLTPTEVSWLSQSNIAEAGDWFPTPAQFKDLLLRIWGPKLIERLVEGEAIENGDEFQVAEGSKGYNEESFQAGKTTPSPQAWGTREEPRWVRASGVDADSVSRCEFGGVHPLHDGTGEGELQTCHKLSVPYQQK